MSNGDPIGSNEPRGKSNAKRMGRYDGSWTPTEQRTRDELMKQFCRDEGPPPSSAYLNAPCWCACGRLKVDGWGMCQRCADATPLGQHPTSVSVAYPSETGNITVTSDPRMEGRSPIMFQPSAFMRAATDKAESDSAPEQCGDCGTIGDHHCGGWPDAR